MGRAFPIQMKKFHICYANPAFPFVAQTIQAISTGLSKTLQRPVLLHNGSEERVMESLFEHDLPRQCVPIEIGGTLDVSTELFIRERSRIEREALEQNENAARILLSSCSDDNGSKAMPAKEIPGDANSSDANV